MKQLIVLIVFCSMLFFAVALPATSKTYKNDDLSALGTYGWSVTLPDEWVQLPDIKPTWPQGAGFASPTSNCQLIITKLAYPSEREQQLWCSRNYAQSESQIKSYRAKTFTRRNAGQIHRLMYITTLKGEYCLAVSCPESEEQAINAILQSFSFINDPQAQPNKPWPIYSDKNCGVSLAHPENCQVKATNNGFTISKDGKTLCSAKFFANSTPPAQSFRGMARSLGMNFRGTSGELVKFSPYEIGQITAYQVMGKATDQSYYGPLVYVPLHHPTWKVMQLYLENQDEGTDFFRIINTLEVRNAGQ